MPTKNPRFTPMSVHAFFVKFSDSRNNLIVIEQNVNDQQILTFNEFKKLVLSRQDFRLFAEHHVYRGNSYQQIEQIQ